MNLHPIVRILALFLNIIGTLFVRDVLTIFIFWILVIIPMLLMSNSFFKHVKFIKIVILPIFLILFCVYGLVLKAPPNELIGSNQLGGILYVLYIVMRLILMAGLFQAFLNIDQSKLISNLKAWGLKGDVLYVTIGAFSIWADIISRSDRIVTALYARGLIPKRSFSSRLKQLPYVFRPLLTSLLRLAIERSECWKQRDSLSRIANLPIAKEKYPKADNIIVLIIAFGWMVYNILIQTQ